MFVDDTFCLIHMSFVDFGFWAYSFFQTLAYIGQIRVWKKSWLSLGANHVFTGFSYFPIVDFSMILNDPSHCYHFTEKERERVRERERRDGVGEGKTEI